MNLNRFNAVELFPIFQNSIKGCDYIAIDFEMSGI